MDEFRSQNMLSERMLTKVGDMEWEGMENDVAGPCKSLVWKLLPLPVFFEVPYGPSNFPDSGL